MIDRRHLCRSAAGFAALAMARPAFAANACDALDSSSQHALTPQAVVDRLQQGNARFVAGTPQNCDLLGQVRATASGQAPCAAVLGCMDSRVPPELVFDQGIGDLFSVRIAGNFVDTDVLGSLEYATAVAGARLVVVLGHSSCGAVKGAIDGVQLGSLTAMLTHLMPAVTQVLPEGGGDSHDHALVQTVALANVQLGVAAVVRDSAVIRTLVEQGSVAVVGAMHDVGTGQITFL